MAAQRASGGKQAVSQLMTPAGGFRGKDANQCSAGAGQELNDLERGSRVVDAHRDDEQ